MARRTPSSRRADARVYLEDDEEGAPEVTAWFPHAHEPDLWVAPGTGQVGCRRRRARGACRARAFRMVVRFAIED